MCDDEGRFLADPRQIKADVWPLDDDITAKKITGWLAKMAEVTVTEDDGSKVPAVQLYAVDGITYGYLPGFRKHQKISHPTPSTLPKPPSIERNTSRIPPEDSGTPQEKLRPEVEEEEDVDLDRDIDLEEEVEGEGEATATTGESSLDQLLKVVPSPDTWRAEVKASLTGMPGHVHATRDQIEIAARDMIANGKAHRNASLRQFRRYIEGAAPDAGPFRSRASPMERSIANTRAAFGGKPS